MLDGYKICDVVLLKKTKPEQYCFERGHTINSG
jgi:hypothetical protein